MTWTIKIESLDQLNKAVQQLIEKIGLDKPSASFNCIAFYGEMGAGKTTIIKEICKSLDVGDITSSPSFSLINEYITNKGRKIYHFDFYRINKQEEVYDLGYEEYFYSNNLCLIEWPEKIEVLLPLPHYKVEILLSDGEKRILNIKEIS
jgi:tRNA threonylcarbamoyladenosine biosynthesis protein TsaE